MVDRRELSLGILFTGQMTPQLTAALTGLRTKMANMAGVQAKVGASAKKAAVGQKQLGDQFTHVGKQLSRVHGGMERLMAAFKVVAAYGIAGTLTFGIINSIRAGTEVIFEFDQALYNLQAITNASEAELNSMGQAIFDVAKRTKFSVKEVSDGMVLLAQSGFTAAESMDAIGAVANLATGTLSDLKTSADLLTTVIRAFGLEASESARVADVMANAINRSKLTVDKLRIAFNYIGPVANKVGLAIEDTAAATMVLANAGIRASTIGTGLRQVLARLKAPSDKLREAFVAAGVDLTKFSGTMDKSGKIVVRMRDIMEELVKVVPDATKAFQLFGLRGAPAVSALTEAGVEGFDKMYEAVLRAGEATRMAETQMEGLAVMAKNLQDRLGTLAVRIGEAGIAGAFELLLRAMREVVKLTTILAEKWYGQLFIATTALSSAILILVGSYKVIGYAVMSVVAILGAVIVKSGHTVKSMMTMIAWTNKLTVAWATLGFAIKAHPLFFIASTLLGLVALWKVLDRHHKKQVLNWETEEKAAIKTIKALEKYKKELSELTSGTIEYGVVLGRLIEDYPELAKYVDLTTKSFNDQGDALDALVGKKAGTALELLGKQIAEYAERVSRLSEAEIEFMPELIGEDALRGTEELDKAVEALSTRVGRLGEVFYRAGFTADSSLARIRFELYRILPRGVSIRFVEELAANVVNGLQKIKSALEEIGKEGEDQAAKFPSYWKSMIGQLDAIEKVSLAEALKTMNTRIAAWEKMAEELGLVEEELAEGRAAYRLKAIEDFIKNVGKEIWTEKEKADKIKEIEVDLLASWRAQQKKRLSDIEIFRDRAKVQASREITDADLLAAEKKKIDEKYDKEKLKEIERVGGLERALRDKNRRRGAASEKEYLDDLMKSRVAYSRMLESLETDDLKKVEAKRRRNFAVLDEWYNRELERAEKLGKDKQEIHDKYDRAKRAIDDKYFSDANKIYSSYEADRLDLEEIYGRIRLEAETGRAAEGLASKEDIRLKELEFERSILEKRLIDIQEVLSKERGIHAENSKEVMDLKKEEAQTLFDLEKNSTDTRMLEHGRYLRTLERSSEAYISYRQKLLRDAGEEEIRIEREKWSLIKQYSDDWLLSLRAGLELAIIDFKLATRNIAATVENMSHHMSAAMEEYFFQVMKGNLKDAHAAWKSFLDAILREIAKFMAERATAEFIALMLRIAVAGAGAYGGGTTKAPAGGESPMGPIVHGGGEIGVDVFPTMKMPSWLVNLAPRVHSGLKPDEFPAILQRGEEVIPRGETSGGDVTVNIMTPDTRTMDQWVRRHRSLFAGATTQSIKEGDKQLVSSIKRVSRG